MSLGDTFGDLLNQAGTAAIDVYRDKSTAKLADRSVDTQGVPVDSGSMPGFPMWVIGAAVVGLVVLVVVFMRR